MDIAPVTVENTSTITFSEAGLSTEGSAYVKAYVWSDFDDMKPLCGYAKTK